MADLITSPGEVEWSGENPGISLKSDPDGLFTALASFIRVVLSPHGRGHPLMLLENPANAGPENVCLTNNEAMARDRVDGFVSKCGAWKGLPGKPVPRVMAGQAISTAMRASSETWIRA